MCKKSMCAREKGVCAREDVCSKKWVGDLKRSECARNRLDKKGACARLRITCKKSECARLARPAGCVQAPPAQRGYRCRMERVHSQDLTTLLKTVT